MSKLNIIQTESGICRRLRTKNSFGSYIGHASFWEDGDSSTAVYWCLDTMGSAGPDDRFAHPHECKAGRECFRPRD
ncbi:MAG TPA: hypothetical protein VF493_02460 [Terriglobales bacterium]|jgi:hypothetical protein